MSTEDRYYQNLDIWSHIHPREAIWLQYFACETVNIFQEDNGFLNLRKGQEKFYLTGNPNAEADLWKATLNLDNIEVLYVYGIGLGYYYPPLKNWLKENPERHLVFLEDDLEVIARLFETEIGSELILDTQVSLFFFRDIAETETIFNRLYWNFPMARLGFGVLEYYKRTKEKKYEELIHQISYDAGLKNSLLEEYLHYGIVFFRNFYANILHINQSYLGNALFGQFENVPAIICGAGPSLQNNISQLKDLGRKAIIFAGSSALNALAVEGITPHFGAGIDPNPMQEERLRHVKDLNFPFLYRNRMYPDALKLVTGPKLYITGSGGYDIADYFEKKFGIEGKFIEEGRNIVNFCLEAAYEMGCNPIIFVGMDLAFTGMKEYSAGVVEDPEVSEEKLCDENIFNETAVVREDIFGEDVHTLWKWVSESRWIGDFANSHPEVTVVNATEGGLGFPGVSNKTLQEVVEEFLREDFDAKSRIEQAYRSHSLSRISQKDIHKAVDELKNSLEKCIEILATLENENNTVMEEIKKTGVITQTQTGKAALVETELVTEPAFVYVLQIFNDVCSKLMQRDILRLMDPKNSASAIEKELEKLDLNSQKYRFLSKVAVVNLEILSLSNK